MTTADVKVPTPIMMSLITSYLCCNPLSVSAHEAPIWVPDTDEGFFSSKDGGVPGVSDIDHNNQVSKISLREVARAIKAAGPGAPSVNVTITKARPSTVYTYFFVDDRASYID